ncbi:MAG: hypothetical protein LBT11_01340 [Treponema sp.]|jgi:hypothetical protein|nr:hypothetical protein [Treponema sp.]
MFYAEAMTLTQRNRFFKIGIALSSLSVALVAAGTLSALPGYPDMAARAVRRAPGLVTALFGALIPPLAYMPLLTTAASVLAALTAAILIYYFFEQTQAPEILFVSFFTLSLAFEAARLVPPLGSVHELPGLFISAAYRVVLFGRYFGLFSLFAASVLAAGLQMQKQAPLILIVVAAALVIALGTPVDSLAWDSSLDMIGGYWDLFRMVDWGIILITVVSFLVAAHTRGSRDYIPIAGGALLALAGRDLLLRADTWLSPLPGLAALILGAWFIMSRLHSIYLWL